MKKSVKRFLSTILALTMLCSCMAVMNITAFADDTTASVDLKQLYDSEKEITVTDSEGNTVNTGYSTLATTSDTTIGTSTDESLLKVTSTANGLLASSSGFVVTNATIKDDNGATIDSIGTNESSRTTVSIDGSNSTVRNVINITTTEKGKITVVTRVGYSSSSIRKVCMYESTDKTVVASYANETGGTVDDYSLTTTNNVDAGTYTFGGVGTDVYVYSVSFTPGSDEEEDEPEEEPSTTATTTTMTVDAYVTANSLGSSAGSSGSTSSCTVDSGTNISTNSSYSLTLSNTFTLFKSNINDYDYVLVGGSSGRYITVSSLKAGDTLKVYYSGADSNYTSKPVSINIYASTDTNKETSLANSSVNPSNSSTYVLGTLEYTVESDGSYIIQAGSSNRLAIYAIEVVSAGSSSDDTVISENKVVEYGDNTYAIFAVTADDAGLYSSFNVIYDGDKDNPLLNDDEETVYDGVDFDGDGTTAEYTAASDYYIVAYKIVNDGTTGSSATANEYAAKLSLLLK